MRAALIIALVAPGFGLGLGCVSKPGRPGGSGSLDAPESCDASRCAAAGGACAGGVCTIDGRPGAHYECPGGMPCRVVCAGDGDCDYVLCKDATSCDVICSGDNSCRLGVGCDTAGTCAVSCSGGDSCKGSGGLPAIGCYSTTCDVRCTGKHACTNGIAVDPAGSCTAACCNGADCTGKTDTCTVATCP